MPIPYLGTRVHLRQPDGSSLAALAWGSTFSVRYTLLDGLPVGPDPLTGGWSPLAWQPDAGVWKTASVTDAAASRALWSGARPPVTRAQTLPPFRWLARAAARAPAAAPPHPAPGAVSLALCVPVAFADVPFEVPIATLNAFCNQEGFSGGGNRGSVRDYYLDVSNGRLDLRHVVAPVVTLARNREWYTDPAAPYGERSAEMAREVLTALETSGFAPGALATDADGFVQALSLVYAGARVNDHGEGLWPHAGSINGGQVYGALRFADYQVTDIGEVPALGTFCHEVGHMLCDFPDLYEYGEGRTSMGVGEFCLMGFGCVADEHNPTRVSAYLRHLAGWTTDVPLPASGTVTINAGSAVTAIHRLNANESILIENRQATGRDEALSASGLAIWHVDSAGSNSEPGASAAQHYLCRLLQADGLQQLEEVGGYGDAGDLFLAPTATRFGPDTSPPARWWSGMPMGRTLSKISKPGPQMTFKVTSG